MPQAQFIQHGDAIDFRPAFDVPAGYVVPLGTMVGITKCPIKANRLGSLALRGVFEVPVEDPNEWSVGAKVRWSEAEEWATAEAGGVFMGRCVKVMPPPASGGPTIRVLVSPT